MKKYNYVRGSVAGRLPQVVYIRNGWTVYYIMNRGSDGQERATYVLRTSDQHQPSLAPLVNKLPRGMDIDVNSPDLPHVIEYRMEADPPLQELELTNLRGKTIGHKTLRAWSEREFLVFAKSFCETLVVYQDAGITGVGVRLDEVLWAESEKRVFLLGWEHSRIDDPQPVDMKTVADLWIELLTGHDLTISPHTYRAGPDWEQVSLGLRALLMRMRSSPIDLRRVIHHVSRLLGMYSAEQDLFDEALLMDPVQALIAYDFLQRAGPGRNRLLPALQAAKRATDRLVESKLWSVRESILKGEYQDAIKTSTEAINITEASTGVWLSANRWYTGANLLTQVIEKKEQQYDTLARRIEGLVVHLIDALDSQLFEDARTILVEIKTSLLGRLKDEIPELRSIENDLEFQIGASQIDVDLHPGASSPAAVQFGKLETLLQEISYAGAVILPEKMVLGYIDESVTYALKTSGVLAAVVEALLKLLERDYQGIERLFSECQNEFATLQSERVQVPPALNMALHQFELIEAEVEHLRSVLKFDLQCFEGSKVTKQEWTRAESALLALESSKIDADLPRWLRASLDLHWVEPLLDLLENYETMDSESIEKRLG